MFVYGRGCEKHACLNRITVSQPGKLLEVNPLCRVAAKLKSAISVPHVFRNEENAQGVFYSHSRAAFVFGGGNARLCVGGMRIQ